MFLLQAVPHCRFGQVLLSGFRSLKHGAYICNVFLKNTGFATKLALMFLEPFLHCFIAGGELKMVEWSAPSPKFLQRES